MKNKFPNPLKEVTGKYPGDEPIEEILATLDGHQYTPPPVLPALPTWKWWGSAAHFKANWRRWQNAKEARKKAKHLAWVNGRDWK